MYGEPGGLQGELTVAQLLSDAGYVTQDGGLVFLQIAKDRPGRGRGQRLARQLHALQRGGAKVIQQPLRRRLRLKRRRQRRQGGAQTAGRRSPLRQQQLRRSQPLQLGDDRSGVGLQTGELASRDVDVGQRPRRVLTPRASRFSSTSVPGVTTRTTCRSTIFLPLPGSSICSQMATLYPLAMILARYESRA